jgi:hypothetical protein
MGRGSILWCGSVEPELRGPGPSPGKVCKVFERLGLGLDRGCELLQELCKSAGGKWLPVKSGLWCRGLDAGGTLQRGDLSPLGML